MVHFPKKMGSNGSIGFLVKKTKLDFLRFFLRLPSLSCPLSEFQVWIEFGNRVEKLLSWFERGRWAPQANHGNEGRTAGQGNRMSLCLNHRYSAKNSYIFALFLAVIHSTMNVKNYPL